MDMAKVKIEWTIEVTETYELEMEFDDFTAMFDEGTAPTLEEVEAGQFDKSDIDAEELAGSEDHETTLKCASVDERYIDSIKVAGA